MFNSKFVKKSLYKKMQEIICNFFHNLLGISWIIQMLVAYFPFIYFSKLDKAMRKNHIFCQSQIF